MTKFCSACKQIKPRHLFKGTSSYCGPCASSYGKNLYRLKKSHSVPENHTCWICRRTEDQIPTATNTITGHKKLLGELTIAIQQEFFGDFFVGTAIPALGRLETGL